jgi:hypothetical protein
LTEPSRTELFAFSDASQDWAGLKVEAVRGDVRKLLQQRALVPARKASGDRVEIEKIGQMHQL